MSIALPQTFRRFITNVPLRWVLTVPFVLSTVGAAALVGYLSYRNGQQAVSDLADRLIQEKGNQVALYLERTLEAPHLINQLNADGIRLGQLPGFETQNSASLEKILWAQLLRFPDVTSIAFANERGGMIGSGRLYQPQSVSMSVYRTPQFARGTYSLSTTDTQGNIIETKIIAQNYDARTRPWYQTPVQAGKATWSPIYQYVSHLESLGVSAGLPIYASSGKLQGVLTADVNLKKLNEFLSDLHISASGQVFIIERSGLLVASSTNQPLSTTQSGKKERLKAGESENPIMRETMAQLATHFGNLTDIEAAQQFTIEQLGVPKFGRVIPFQDEYGLDWLIVVVIPESDFMGTIQNQTHQTFLLCLLTLGVALTLGLLAANHLTARFTQLNRVSHKLAAGNLDQRLPTDNPIYELNNLAQMFNQMADQLQQSFDHIKTALAESEEKFTIIFHSSPDPIALATLIEGRYVEANESFLKLLDYSHQELTGQRFVDLGVWVDLEERAYFRQALLQQGHVRNLEVQLNTRTGQIKTVLISAEQIEINGEAYVLSIVRDISARKATELALQQSETRYRAIVEDQTELIVRFSPDTTLIFVNDAYCRYFGISQEEVIGKSYRLIIYEADQARVAQLLQSMSADNPTVTIENRLIVNGEIRWTQWVNRMLFDQQGNFAEIQSVGRDITQLKQIEEALRKSEANLLQAQRIAQVGSWEYDLATEKITWSEELFRIFGLDPTQSELSYVEVLEMLPAEDQDALTTAVRQAIADSSFYEVEHRIRHPDGTTHFVISKGQVVFNDQQQVFKLYGAVLDITERKRAEAALQESETRFRQLAETVQEGFFVFETASAHYSYVNPAYTVIMGTPSQSIYNGMFHWLNQIHPDDRQRIEAGLQRERQGEDFDQEYRFIRPNGELRWLRSKAFPLQDETGTVVRIVGTVEDITERKRIEDERKRTEIALRESEERFRQIAENINQLFFVSSADSGQFLYISPAYEKIWGRTCESLYQNPGSWLAAIYPDDRPSVLHSIKNQTQRSFTQREYRIIRPDGEIRWIFAEIFLMVDEAGHPLRYTGFAEDVTDRKQLEQSLRSQAEEERLLATISQHIRQSLDLEQILATTVVEVQRTLQADRVLIFQLHQDGSGQVIQEAVLPEYSTITQMRWLDECFPDECYEFYLQGNPRIVPDVATDDWASCLAEFMQEAGIKSKVVAPIVQVSGESSTTVWGLLVVHACSHYRQWQESEADFLQQICNQLAIAIDQANLYQQLQTELAERRQAENALRQSEARLAMAQKVAQVGYWEFDFETQTRTWSEITFPQWGLDPTQPEPTLDELFEMVHPDDRAALQQNRERTITEGIPYTLDLRVVHPDGSIHYLDSRAEPVFNDQGQVVKLIGTSVDVTERKQTEKALQEREAMLRGIGDNLPKGFIYQRTYEPGKGFYYSYVSAGVERLLGIKPEALLKNSQVIRGIGFAEELAYADEIVQESLKNLTPIELQMRNRTATGEIQWSSIRSTPRRLEDGRTVWDGVEVDITDLKQTEFALRASEEQFRRAFDDAPIGISLVSPTGQFVKVNSRYCNLLGYTEAELLALTFQEITHPADLEADTAGLRQMVTGETLSFQLEKRYITKQGTVIPVAMNAALIKDQNEQPLYCVGHIQDIRDRLKVERMKDEFISIVSHELRTPLTSIRGALGILGSGIFDNRPQKAQHMLNIAINNSDRLVRLVDDILSLERLESGKVQLVMEHCQVKDLMQQAVDSVQAIADQSNITLSLTSLSATLWAAPDAIIQTLTNLLSNAIKFSSSGHTVCLKAELQGGEEWRNRGTQNPSTPQLLDSHILFSIADQGRGIPEDKLAIIFERFQQVDVSDSRKKGGTGLGLAICRNIVQQHGGQIWAESSVGKGSTFYVALPLTTEARKNSESN